MNLDALEMRFTIRGNLLSPEGIYKFSSGVLVQKAKNRIRKPLQFKNIYEVRRSDQILAYLFTNPQDNFYYKGKDIVILRVENWFLYQREIEKFIREMISGFQTNYNISFMFHSFQHIDVAMDTDVDIVKRFKYLFNRKSRYTFINDKKLRVRSTGTFDDEINIGSIKKRRRMITIYNKTRELSAGNKQYLGQLYSEIFGSSVVFRAEVKLFNTHANKYLIDPYMLDNSNYLLSIFKMVIDEMIDFRINSGSNVTRQKKVCFINFQKQLIVIPLSVPIKLQQGNNSIKYLIKQLFEDSLGRFSNFSQSLKFIAELYIKAENLDEWCVKKNIRK